MWTETQLAPWLAALEAGGVAAAPAEGVYGYCADALNATALESLIALKNRRADKGFICLVPDIQSLSRLCPTLPSAAQSAVQTFWPCPQKAPVTLILPALKNLPPQLVGGHGTIAVRLPSTPYMQHYLRAWKQRSGHGILVSTSLNTAGEPPATQTSQIPPSTAALTLPQPLSGTPSRIFNPLDNTWIR